MPDVSPVTDFAVFVDHRLLDAPALGAADP